MYDTLPHGFAGEGELLLGVKSERAIEGLAEVNDAKEVPEPDDHVLVESGEPELLIRLAGLIEVGGLHQVRSADDALEWIDRELGAEGLQSRGEDVATSARMFPDSSTDGVVDSINGAGAETVCRSSVPGGDDLTASNSRSALASNCDAGAHGGSREGPDANAQVVALDVLLYHVVHGVACSRANSVSHQAVDGAVKAAPQLVSDQIADCVLAVYSSNHRGEADDVVQLDRGVFSCIVVVEWIERAREAAVGRCSKNRVHAEIHWCHALAAVLGLAVECWWVVKRRRIGNVVEHCCGQGFRGWSLSEIGWVDDDCCHVRE
jgi:hypothetical protein